MPRLIESTRTVQALVLAMEIATIAESPRHNSSEAGSASTAISGPTPSPCNATSKGFSLESGSLLKIDSVPE